MKIKFDFDSLGHTLLLLQIIVLLLKILKVIKCSWYVTLTPLYLWIAVTLGGFVLFIYLIMKNKM